MANLGEVMQSLALQVSAAFDAAGLSSDYVGSEWPSDQLRFDAGKPGHAPVAAVIHKLTTSQDKNMDFEHSESFQETSIASAISDFVLSPSGAVTLTVSMVPLIVAINVGDLVSATFTTADQDLGASCVTIAGDTLTTIATRLAAAINTLAASGTPLPGVSASAAGAVVTVTNAGTTGYKFGSNTGHTIFIKQAVDWEMHNLQINAWTNNLDLKYQVQGVITNLLNTLKQAKGFNLPSGEFIEFHKKSHKSIGADTDKDVYTDFFLFDCEHWSDIDMVKYSVVAPLKS